MWLRLLSRFSDGDTNHSGLPAFSNAASGSTHRLRGEWIRLLLQRPPVWLTLLGCAVILGIRRIDVLRDPQFWAEDGPVFFQQAWTLGWRAMLEPYAGYLSIGQRLVAAAAVQFHPKWAPSLFMAAAASFTLYTAARTQSSRCPLPPHAGYALAVVLVPDAFEVLLFLVNTQWLAAPALLLLLISTDARRWWQHAHDAAAACLLGLTGPFSLLFAPLFAWRAWCRRTRASCVLAGLVLGCGAVQGWLIWKNPVHMTPHRVAHERVLAAPGLRVAGSLLIGHRVSSDIPLPIGNLLGVLALTAVAALVLRKGPARVERIWLALAFGILLAASLQMSRGGARP